MENGQELTSGDQFEFNAHDGKKRNNDTYEIQKEVDVPRGLPYTVNTAASVNV